MKYIIAAPGDTATGGPELCHQFAHSLIKMGIEAHIYYYKTGGRQARAPKEFEHYNVPSVNGLHGCDVLVVPEIRTDLLRKSKAKYKVVWWQSINNYYKYFLVGTSLKRRLLGKNILTLKDFLHNEYIHLAQSYYAELHLETLGVKNIFPLKDYLSDEFNQLEKPIRRENRVLYNPKKGAHIYDVLLPRLKDKFEFVPLQGYTRNELINLMLSSKVYLDLGEHPGMDRMPREAMLCGCIPICRMSGSAANFKDVPVPGSLKIERNVDAISLERVLTESLDNYENILPSMGGYIDFIKSQKQEFLNQLTFLTRSVFI